MLPPLEELKGILETLHPGLSLTIEAGALVVPAGKLTELCRTLKDNDRFRIDYLSNLCAADYPPETIEVVYHLFSVEHKHGPIALKVKLPRANPAVDSVTPIWRGAEFQEREAYDLYGVKFQGHPDMRRILLWDEFEGHPMRKDYVIEEQDLIEDPKA